MRIKIPAHERGWPKQRTKYCYLAMLDDAIFVIKSHSIFAAKKIAENQIGPDVEVLPFNRDSLLSRLNFSNGVSAICEVL